MNETKKLIFDFNWRLTLCVVIFFPLLVSLSLWQIDRAEEKITIRQAWENQQSAEPVAFSKTLETTEYQRIFAQGRFLPAKYWLKENQFFNGQLGYHVVMPFETASGAVIAVDRGWVQGTARRDYQPPVTTPAGDVRIVGVLARPSDSKLIREDETSVKGWPHKILEIDLRVMSRQSELRLLDKVLRLDADSPGALIAHWKPINVSPAKHYGYAVQWALMALALIILYVFASTNLSEFLKAKRNSHE